MGIFTLEIQFDGEKVKSIELSESLTVMMIFKLFLFKLKVNSVGNPTNRLTLP